MIESVTGVMSMMKTDTRSEKTDAAIAASLAVRQKRRRRVGDKVVTDGVVCYYDGDTLLIVPAQQGASGVDVPPSA
jgi:hypothetical protein